MKFPQICYHLGLLACLLISCRILFCNGSNKILSIPLQRPFFIFAPPPHTHLPLPSIFVPPATKKMLVNMQLSYFIPLLRRKTYTTCTIKSISTAKLNTIDCRLHPNDHHSMCFQVLGELILI